MIHNQRQTLLFFLLSISSALSGALLYGTPTALEKAEKELADYQVIYHRETKRIRDSLALVKPRTDALRSAQADHASQAKEAQFNSNFSLKTAAFATEAATDRKRIQAKIAQLRKDLEKQKQIIAEGRKKQLEELKQQAKQLDESRLTEAEKLTAQIATIKALTTEAQQIESRVSETIKNANTSADTNTEKIEEQIKIFTTEDSKNRATHEKVTDTISQQANLLTSQKEAITSSQESITSGKESLNKINKELSDYEIENSANAERLSAETAALKKVQADLRTFKEATSQRKKNSEDLTDDITENKKTTEQLEAQIAALKKEIQENEESHAAEMKELEEQAADLDKQLDE